MGVINSLIQYLANFRTSYFEVGQRVGKRQQRVGIANGDITSRDINTYATRVLDGHIGVFAQEQEGIGHHIGNIAATVGVFARAGGIAVGHTRDPRQAQVFSGHANNVIAEGVELLRVAAEHRLDRGIRRGQTQLGIGINSRQHLSLGITRQRNVIAGWLIQQQVRYAFAGDHIAFAVPLYIQLANHLGVFPGLGHADRVAISIGDPGWILATGIHTVSSKIAQQGVGVATDDDIHTRQLTRQVQVVLILIMRQQDDLVDALLGQLVDHRLGRFLLIQKLGRCQRAGAALSLAADIDADHPDLLAVHLVNVVRLDVVVFSSGRQWRAYLWFDVGSQHCGVTAICREVIEEINQPRIAPVKLVVTQGKGIETDLVHQGGVSLTRKTGEVQRAGDRIAGVQFQHVVQLGFTLCHFGCHTRKSAQRKTGFGASDIKIDAAFFQIGMVIVDMQNIQRQRLSRRIVVSTAVAITITTAQHQR